MKNETYFLQKWYPNRCLLLTQNMQLDKQQHPQIKRFEGVVVLCGAAGSYGTVPN